MLLLVVHCRLVGITCSSRYCAVAILLTVTLTLLADSQRTGGGQIKVLQNNKVSLHQINSLSPQQKGSLF